MTGRKSEMGSFGNKPP